MDDALIVCISIYRYILLSDGNSRLTLTRMVRVKPIYIHMYIYIYIYT